jgi:hypothetical protein
MYDRSLLVEIEHRCFPPKSKGLLERVAVNKIHVHTLLTLPSLSITTYLLSQPLAPLQDLSEFDYENTFARQGAAPVCLLGR